MLQAAVLSFLLWPVVVPWALLSLLTFGYVVKWVMIEVTDEAQRSRFLDFSFFNPFSWPHVMMSLYVISMLLLSILLVVAVCKIFLLGVRTCVNAPHLVGWRYNRLQARRLERKLLLEDASQVEEASQPLISIMTTNGVEEAQARDIVNNIRENFKQLDGGWGLMAAARVKFFLGAILTYAVCVLLFGFGIGVNLDILLTPPEEDIGLGDAMRHRVCTLDYWGENNVYKFFLGVGVLTAIGVAVCVIAVVVFLFQCVGRNFTGIRRQRRLQRRKRNKEAKKPEPAAVSAAGAV